MVASISRLLNIIGLFCKRALQKRRYPAKETYDFKDPTNRSHPIHRCADTTHTETHIHTFIDTTADTDTDTHKHTHTKHTHTQHTRARSHTCTHQHTHTHTFITAAEISGLSISNGLQIVDFGAKTRLFKLALRVLNLLTNLL